MEKIAPYAKAIIAAIVAGLGSLYQALDGNSEVTAQEWVAVAMTTLAGLVAVFAVSNRDPHAEHQDESVQPPDSARILGKAVAPRLPDERGESYVGLAIVALVVVVLVLVIARLL